MRLDPGVRTLSYHLTAAGGDDFAPAFTEGPKLIQLISACCCILVSRNVSFVGQMIKGKRE